jgi:mevalonate kinase
MSELTETLLEMKEEIEENEKGIIAAKGKLEAKMEQLKQEFDCETVEEAEALLVKMQKGITKNEGKLQEVVEALQELGWEV